ncbi:MAG: hypothetical protein CVU09_00380 [Bacteroidetes bacterium HGW-Bacteroidetes-4]|jgi:excisionase family DNA binding protein|nr:MAG: hypothetical protein CVU09_00380 [Bacteroidetes bacterium HGW-Bacteroidetes-4]
MIDITKQIYEAIDKHVKESHRLMTKLEKSILSDKLNILFNEYVNFDKITFDSLPSAVSQVIANQRAIIDLISKKEDKVEKEGYLTVNELTKYLPEKPSKHTVYSWVFYRKIPFQKNGRKSLLFKKSEIDEWLHSGRQMNHLKND